MLDKKHKYNQQIMFSELFHTVAILFVKKETECNKFFSYHMHTHTKKNSLEGNTRKHVVIAEYECLYAY